MRDPVFTPLQTAIDEVCAQGLRPQKTLSLHDSSHLTLDERVGKSILRVQAFYPYAELLAHQGLTSQPFWPSFETGEDEKFDLIILPLSKFRQAARSDMAKAAKLLAKDGTIFMAAANLQGARALFDDAIRLFGPCSSLSIAKGRAFWAGVSQLDHALCEEFINLGHARLNKEGYYTQAGLFSPDHLDPGSAFLLEQIGPVIGKGADFGAGYGALMRPLLERNDAITSFLGLEADHVAINCAKLNLEPFLDRSELMWTDVRKNAPEFGPFDFIVSNPPFHQDRADQPEIGQDFIRAAAKALKKGGVFYCVANKHLPYEETFKSVFKSHTIRAINAAYKLIEATL